MHVRVLVQSSYLAYNYKITFCKLLAQSLSVRDNFSTKALYISKVKVNTIFFPGDILYFAVEYDSLSKNHWV